MTSNLEELLHSREPIDITGKIYICDDECLFRFDNLPEPDTKIQNENDLLTIIPSGESNIAFNNPDYCPEFDQYKLKVIFINGPSRQTLYGKRYDLGIELVYTTKDEKEIVIITVFGDANLDDKFSDSYQFLEELAEKYFPQHLKSINLPNFNPGKLIPPQKKRTFFTYQRSQKVKKIVMENPISIPANFMQKFTKYVVPSVQYKSLKAKPPTPPGANMIIYATVPPTVSETPNKKDLVDVVEHFDTPIEPADEQWGYMGVVAGIVTMIILLLVVIAGAYFDPDLVMGLVQQFLGLGLARIGGLALLAIGTTFGMAWWIETVPSNTAGKRAGKFFAYMTWYLTLTGILVALVRLLGKPAEAITMKEGWLERKLDYCPETYGLAVPTEEDQVMEWPEKETPTLIGVETS